MTWAIRFTDHLDRPQYIIEYNVQYSEYYFNVRRGLLLKILKHILKELLYLTSFHAFLKSGIPGPCTGPQLLG